MLQKKREGQKKSAPDVKEDYDKLTSTARKTLAGDKLADKEKTSDSYHVISDMDKFVKFIGKIPAANLAKLTESPFKHLLKLKNDQMQLKNICVTLSHYFDDKKVQLGEGDVLDVTEERFWKLMKIKNEVLDPID
ncbi:hypothetical protein Tco_0655138, partial [Tanacetum coccineum]